MSKEGVTDIENGRNTKKVFGKVNGIDSCYTTSKPLLSFF